MYSGSCILAPAFWLPYGMGLIGMAMLTDTVTDALKSVLINPWQSWLAEHPVVAWLILHPLWSLGLVGLSLLLFAGLWSAIARLTEGFWLTLVRLPFQVGGWLFVTTANLLLHRWNRAANPTEPPHRLSAIMARLEQLHLEQAELLAEMRQLIPDEQLWNVPSESVTEDKWDPPAEKVPQKTRAGKSTPLSAVFPAQSEQ